jgi:hypothetical protein
MGSFEYLDRTGEERIANELLLKLRIRVSPRTVNKYLPRRPRGRPRGDLRWSTFLRLHAQGITVAALEPPLFYTFLSAEGVSAEIVSLNREINAPRDSPDEMNNIRVPNCSMAIPKRKGATA